VSFDRQIVEARLALDLIASVDMPAVAQDALEAGIDGPATLRLAILDRPTYFEVKDLLQRARQEWGLSDITKGEAARRIAKQIAAEILNRGDDVLTHLREFEWLWIRSGYSREIRNLGALWDDVWIAESTGQSQEAIREIVVSRLKAAAKS
jgi:hypothetical protein